MGLDISSYVVYGKVVPKKLITQHKTTRSCSHDTDETKSFCSECGQPVWHHTKVIPLDSMEDNGLSYFYENYENQDKVIVGFVLQQTPSHRNQDETVFFPLAEVTPIMTTEIMTFFNEIGVSTTEKDFKIFLFQHSSY